MSRVPLIDYATAPPGVRALMEATGNPERQMNVARLIANHPDFYEGFQAMVRGLYRNNVLAPRLRELTYPRTSQLNQCHY